MRKPTWMQLSSHAIVVPALGFRKFKPLVLGAGSIVSQQRPDVAKPRLDWRGEQLVEYVDPSGQLVLGHVDHATILVPASRATEHVSIAWQPADGSRLQLADMLREAVALARTSTVAYVKTLRLHEGNRTFYAGIVRERGGKVKPDDPELVERLLRLTLSDEALTMARKKAETEIEEQDDEMEEQDEQGDDEGEEEDEAPAPKRKSAKKGAAKKGTAKKAAANGEGRTPQGVTLGTTLVGLLREAGVKGEPLQSAKALQSGETLKKGVLIKLRDAVNEAAGSVREDNASLASKLSSANRVVRRLSRV